MVVIFTKKEEREKREKTCETCEKRENKRCGICGCFLIALKKFQYAKCPLNKW